MPEWVGLWLVEERPVIDGKTDYRRGLQMFLWKALLSCFFYNNDDHVLQTDRH